jgi:hypothetical protein
VKTRDALTGSAQTIGQIALGVDRGKDPWDTLTPVSTIRGDLASLVAQGVAVRVSLPVGHGWRLAVTS